MLILAALLGCADTRVDGRVDGEIVDVSTAAYAEIPGLFGEDGALLVYLLPGYDACSTMTAWMEIGETSRDPAELTEQWNATFPHDFWEVDLVLRVPDPSESATGDWLYGTAWNENTEESGEAYAELVHSLQARDADFFGGVIPNTDDYLRRWYSHRGLLQVSRHAPGERLSGVFTTQAADPTTGALQGDLVIRFDAARCADLETILSR